MRDGGGPGCYRSSLESRKFFWVLQKYEKKVCLEARVRAQARAEGVDRSYIDFRTLFHALFPPSFEKVAAIGHFSLLL